MKKIIFAIIIIVVIAIIFVFLPIINKKNISVDQSLNRGRSVLTNMKITSSAFQNNSSIPSLYTCDGANINPPLTFSDIPAGAKSLALIMDDPDAPSGTWDHWLFWNLPPSVTEIKEGVPPAEAIVGVNSWPKIAYGGPCPPDREHRYFFKLYALDTMLNLSRGSTKKEVESAMSGHIIAQAELVGKYNRK